MQLIIKPLEIFLTYALRVGRALGTAALALMVIITLLQVFMRYVLNNALPWPDEAARFLLLWMTGLMAPSAYRWGGFVAIDTFTDMLSERAGLILNIFILLLSLTVLIIALQLGLKHIKSGWLFDSSSLKIPLQIFGGEPVRLKLAWMYMSLYVGFVGMTLVCIEMLLKNFDMLFGGRKYSEVPDQHVLSAE